MTYHYLLDIALILISTKLLSLITKKFQMPQVVGALIAGLVLGPAVLNILNATDFLTKIAELGVIIIMFSAGLETDMKELKKTGKAGLIVAFCGVMIPLVLGTLLAYFYNKGEFTHPGNALLQNIFFGVILTATSVSITVETLKEMGKLNTNVGNTILAAALIDDILGLIALTMISGMAGLEVNILVVLLKIMLFFVLIGIVGYIAWRGFEWYSHRVNHQDLHRFPIMAFVMCLLLSYVAEHFFGVADIIGAFAAGVIISNTKKSSYIESRIRPLSYLLLAPIFFASIGINVVLPSINITILIFSVLLIAVAIFSKLVGCGIGAKFCGFTNRESIQVGFGMACRGEVALIVANKGLSMNVLPPAFMGPIVIMVVCTAVFTPVLLKMAFKKDKNTIIVNSALVDDYQEEQQLEDIK